MKKSEAIMGPLEPEEIKFLFNQLKRDLFSDRYITAVMNIHSEEYQNFQQLVFINQRIGKEYSFPGITFKEKESC
jgi:hypothetical protein